MMGIYEMMRLGVFFNWWWTGFREFLEMSMEVIVRRGDLHQVCGGVRESQVR